MFEICKSDHEYCKQAYQQAYESFIFSLGMYANHKIYRRKLLKDIMKKFDDITDRHLSVGLVSGRYGAYYKRLTLSAYEQTVGEKK